MQLVADFAIRNKDKVFRLTAINDDAAEEAVKLREESKENSNNRPLDSSELHLCI